MEAYSEAGRGAVRSLQVGYLLRVCFPLYENCKSIHIDKLKAVGSLHIVQKQF